MTNEPEQIMLSFRVNKAVSDQLDEIARAKGRSRTYVLVEATRAYITDQLENVEMIERSLNQAESADYASADTIESTFSRMMKDFKGIKDTE